MDWAKYRRRKVAAKMHLRSGPLCRACGGEIAVSEKACVQFDSLFHLHQRGIFWVTRAKANLRYHVCRKRLHRPSGKILRDDVITLVRQKSKAEYPQRLRPVEALVEVDGEERVMVFLTNNLDWALPSVCDL